MSSKIGEFKGQPTIILEPESMYPFSFGLWKAKAILKNLDAIRAFVASEETAEKKFQREKRERAEEERLSRHSGVDAPW